MNCRYKNSGLSSDFWSCFCDKCYVERLKPTLEQPIVMFNDGETFSPKELYDLIIFPGPKEPSESAFIQKMINMLEEINSFQGEKDKKIRAVLKYFNSFIGNMDILNTNHKLRSTFIFKMIDIMTTEEALAIRKEISEKYLDKVSQTWKLYIPDNRLDFVAHYPKFRTCMNAIAKLHPKFEENDDQSVEDVDRANAREDSDCDITVKNVGTSVCEKDFECENIRKDAVVLCEDGECVFDTCVQDMWKNFAESFAKMLFAPAAALMAGYYLIF